MVNSESMDSPGDGKAKDCITQLNSVSSNSHSPSPVTASSLCLREMNFANETADISTTECGSPMDSPPETAVTGDEESSRLTVETENVEISGLYCSVPLNKVQDVLNSYTIHLNNQPFESNSSTNNSSGGETRNKKLLRKLLCLYCDRTFVTTNLRQKHVDRCHSVKQARRYSSRFQQTQSTTACIFCSKLNNTDHSLKELFIHLVDEHPNKYFACVDCEERFLFKSHLEEHDFKMHNIKLLDASDDNAKDCDLPEETRPRLNGAIFTHDLILDGDGESNENQKTKIIKTKHKTKIKNEITPAANKIIINSSNRPNLRMSVRKELRKKKVAVKSTKVGVKRNTRLQAKITQTKPIKKRTKTGSKVAEKNITPKVSEISEKSTGCVNPYPTFDAFFRVKKITDHSIDNLKISSLTFDDVFDKAFYNRIKCNIQENLQNHIDGKLFKNEESESRISNFEKMREVNSSPAENFGCELTLNAATPVVSLLSTQFGEDLESQIEYGSKASKKKPSPKKDEVHYKYFTRRKYQASILESKENRDLSKLDMWTQLLVKNRQQKIINDKKTEKEKLEYIKGDEYRTKMKNEELNRILDRRGPFEDLKEEANKKAAMEKLHRLGGGVNCEAITDVTYILNDVIDSVVAKDNQTVVTHEELNSAIDEVITVKVDCDRDCEIPFYLNLRQSSSLVGEPDVDRSDRITLICSSQETENFEECNIPRDKNVLVELSGEWTRSRIYICAACGVKVANVKMLIEHKSIFHQNGWVQHYEFVGNQSELYRHLSIPGLGKVGYVEDFPMSKVWKRSDARFCTKCSKTCNSLAELHRHVLECGEDWSWMLARRKLKYRPFGAKSRRKRRGLVKRILHSKEKQSDEVREKKKYNIKRIDGPRPKPSDADTIQRMLANLPAKRASRKIISLKDGFPKPMKRKRQAGKNLKQDQIKSKSKKILGKTKKALQSMKNSREITKNGNQVILRKSVRNINKVFSSKLLDTNSALLVKRKFKTSLQHHRITRSKREFAHEQQDEKGIDLLTRTKTGTKNSPNKNKKLLEVQDVVTTSKSTPLRRTRSAQSLNKSDAVDDKSRPETETADGFEINDKVDGGLDTKLSLNLKKLKKSKEAEAKLKTQSNPDLRDEHSNGKLKVKNGKRKSSLSSLKKAIKKIKLREKPITNIVQVDGSSQINDEILPFLENIHLSDDRDDDYAKTSEVIISYKPAEETNQRVDENLVETAPTNQIPTANEVNEQEKKVGAEEITIKTEVLTQNDVVNVAITNDANKSRDVTTKPKVRKRVKGLNDCIAMLTSKLQQRVGEKLCVSNGEICNVTELTGQQKTTEFIPSPSLPIHFRPPTPPHSPNQPRPPTPPRSPTPPSSSLPPPPPPRPLTLLLPPSSLPTLPPSCPAPPPPTFSFPPPSFPSSPLNLFITKNHIQQVKLAENQNGLCENNYLSPQNEGKLCNILSSYTFGENLAPSFYENVGTCFRNISKLSGLIAAETPTLKDDDVKKVNGEKADDDKLANLIDGLHRDTGKFKEVDVNIEIDLFKCLEKVGDNNVNRTQEEKPSKKKKTGKFNDKRKENINVITRDNFVETEVVSNLVINESENDLGIIKSDDVVVLNNGNDNKIAMLKPKKKNRKKTVFPIDESKTFFKTSLVLKINHLTSIEQITKIDDLKSKEVISSTAEKPQKKKGKRKKIGENVCQYDMKTLLVEEQEPELMENKSLSHLSERNIDSERNSASESDFQATEEINSTQQEGNLKKTETDSEDEVPLALLVKNTTPVTVLSNAPDTLTEISESETTNIPETLPNQIYTDFSQQNQPLINTKSSELQPQESNKKRVKSTERKRKPKNNKKPDQKDVYDFDIEDEDRIAGRLKISTAIFQTKNKGLLFPAREKQIGNDEEEEEEEEAESEKNKDTQDQPAQVGVLEIIKTEPEANDEEIPDVRYCCEENIQKFAPETEETLEVKITPVIMMSNENCKVIVETEQMPEVLNLETRRDSSEDMDIPNTDVEETITEMNIIEDDKEGRDAQHLEPEEITKEIEETSEMNMTHITESCKESITAVPETNDMTVEALEMKIRRSIMLSNEKLRLEAQQDPIQDNTSSISEELQIIKDIIAEAEQDLIQQANNNGHITIGDRKTVKKNKKCKKKNEKAKTKRENPIKTKTKLFPLDSEIAREISPMESIFLDDEGIDIEMKLKKNHEKEEGVHSEKTVASDSVILSAQLFLENNDDILPVEGKDKELQVVIPELQDKNDGDSLETNVIQQKIDDVLDETFGSIDIEQELSQLENKENLHSVNKGIKDAWEEGLLLNFGSEFEEYEIQEIAANAKMSNNKKARNQKPDETLSDLKMSIDISEMNHPIVLSPELNTKKDKKQMDLSEESEKPIENGHDTNIQSYLDTSISCSQQNMSDASSSDKVNDEIKDTSNSSFNNSVDVVSKKTKRGVKSKTMKLNIKNSNSFNSENQVDSFLQTPDLNDSAIAEKIKAQFKVKGGSKKANRNRKTSLEKLYCDICDKMFVRCDNLVKHRRTLTHIAKLSELEAKEAAEKAKANTIENSDDYKMNINISDILNKSQKEAEPDVNSEIANKIQVNSPFMLNTNSDTLKLADIINDVLNKPVGNGDIKNYSEPTVPVPINSISKEPKRYKSLGERKSFESDINTAYTFNNLHMGEDIQLSKLSTNADSILKHPISISILENIIENQGPFDYIDDITVSSNKSVEGQLSRNSPSELSVMSDSKQYDSNQITFTHNTNIMSRLIKPVGLNEDNFVKPTQYEEISNDSSSVRNHFDDPRQRKALNRDEELFLECCSLLKSSSEVSSYSKRSSKNVANNFEMKPIDEPDWLEQKSFSAKNQEFRNDAFSDSCPNTPLGDGFGDEYSNTNSNTIASDWNSKQKGQQQQQQQTIAVENPIFEDISLDNSKDEPLNNEQNSEVQGEYNGNHFRIFSSEKYTSEKSQTAENSISEIVGEEEIVKDVDNDLRKKMVSRFGGLMAKAFKNSLQAVKKSKQHKKKQLSENTQTSITDYVVPLSSNKAESDLNDNKKMLTKGAMKVFEGLKVSIPTDDLDIKELLNGTFGPKKSVEDTSESSKHLETESVSSKAMKISMKFGNKLGLKVTKKKHTLKLRKSPSPKCNNLDDNETSKKAHDVYDFEETQDNTDIFSKSNFTNLTAFRNQIIEKKSATGKPDSEEIIIESDSESNNQLLDSFDFEAQSVSSFSTESNMSVKKPKQKNITKKKCMIMGRIFKNAFKSKIEDDIRDIPIVDNSKLVEDYVMQLPESDKNPAAITKMSENEMDLLFDKLLLEQGQPVSKKVDEVEKPSLEVKQKSATTKPKPKPVAKRKRQRQNSDSTDDEFNIGKPRKRNNKKKQNNVDDGINLEQELKECIGVASRKSQRKCTSGKQNVLVEFWSSDDSNFESVFYSDPVPIDKTQGLDEIPAVIQEIENNVNNEPDLLVRTTEEPIAETQLETNPGDLKIENEKPKIPKVITKPNNKQIRRKSNPKHSRNKEDEDKEDRKLKNIKVTSETLAANRRKRAAADTLYYWSSSSEDESQDLIEVKPIRDEVEEDDDRPIHHGWIVGDSPKKLVTMLAQAKGKKVDAESVKEQSKKRTTL